MRNYFSPPVLPRLALLLAGALAACQAAALDLGTQKSFDIPAQELSSALIEFARQTNIQVMTASNDVAGLQATAVQGTMSVKSALSQLLAGTGLRYEDAGVNSIAVGKFKAESTTATTEPKSFRMAQAAPAAGAGAAAKTADNADKALGLEEVVVTAQKRSETLQNVPLAVSALSEETLRSLGAVEFSDYARLVPGLAAVDLGAGQKKYVLRGLNSESAPRLAAIVQQYLDEFPLSRGALQSDIRLYDVERVEVLRGPQGTLYGSGSMGGTIRTITRKPNLNKSEGRIELTGSGTQGGSSNFLGNAVLNMPLIPGKLAIRALAYDEQRSGFIDNLYTGKEDTNKNDVFGGRLSLMWQATDALAFDLMVMRQSLRAGGQNDVMTGFVAPPPPPPQAFPPSVPRPVPWFPVNTPSIGDYEVYKGIDESQRDINTITNLLTTYDFGWAQLTSSSTYYQQHTVRFQDTAELLGFGGYLKNDNASKTFGQELRLGSDHDALKWLLGAYYLRTTTSLLDGTQSSYAAGGTLLSESGGQSESVEKAAFGEVSYDFLPQLTGTFGIRSAKSENTSKNVTLIGVGPGGGPGTVNGPYSADDDKVTTKYELTYRPTAETTLYGLAAQGFRPGGFNQAAFNPIINVNGDIPQEFSSDKLWNYELGLKTYLFDRRATFNTAVYYIDWSNIQVTGFNSTGTITFTTNASKARVQGVETELTFAATRNLRLALSGAFTDARLTADQPARPGGSNNAIGLTGVNGNRLPDVPRWSGSFMTDYRHNLGFLPGWMGFVTGTLSYTGESGTVLRPEDQAYRIQGNYALANLRFGVEQTDWRVTAFIDNLTDRRARLFVNTLSGWDKTIVNRPRTVGLTLSKQF